MGYTKCSGELKMKATQWERTVRVLIACVGLGVSGLSCAGEPFTVVVGPLEVRLQGKVVSKLQVGQSVEKIGDSPGWVEVKLDLSGKEERGYIEANSFVRSTKPSTAEWARLAMLNIAVEGLREAAGGSGNSLSCPLATLEIMLAIGALSGSGDDGEIAKVLGIPPIETGAKRYLSGRDELRRLISGPVSPLELQVSTFGLVLSDQGRITTVFRDSPAYQMGLRAGDKLTTPDQPSLSRQAMIELLLKQKGALAIERDLSIAATQASDRPQLITETAVLLPGMVSPSKEGLALAVDAGIGIISNSGEGQKGMSEWLERSGSAALLPKVKQLLDESGSEVAILNVSKFRNVWANRFRNDRTALRMFELPDGTKVQRETMTVTGRFAVLKSKDDSDPFTSVAIPYGSGNQHFIAVMPNGKLSDAVKSPRADASQLSNLIESVLKVQTQHITLRLPKFTFEHKQSVKQTMTKLGLKSLFSPKNGLFDVLGLNGPQYVKEIEQRTQFKVDESGSVATAVTAAVIGSLSAPPEVNIDRPFLFFVVDGTSKTVMFAGSISDPKSTVAP